MEKISIKDLNAFDRDYLKKHFYFSEKDSFGRDRNKGQFQIGRKSKGTSPFELALTAISHEIMRRCLAVGIDVIATYHINQYVLAADTDTATVERIAARIIAEFIYGKEINVQMTDKEFAHYSKISQQAYIETANNVIQNGTANELLTFLNLDHL